VIRNWVIRNSETRDLDLSILINALTFPSLAHTNPRLALLLRSMSRSASRKLRPLLRLLPRQLLADPRRRAPLLARKSLRRDFPALAFAVTNVLATIQIENHS
jgi:hypothetical protein